MVDQEDNSYFKEFLARAERRQKRLDEIEVKLSNQDKPDVSYPPLSPLIEEQRPRTSRGNYLKSSSKNDDDDQYDDQDESTVYRNRNEDDDDDDEDESEQDSVSLQENVASSNTRNRKLSDIRQDSDLNYSSDLSLDITPEDPIYRAEPVVCESSPEQPMACGSTAFYSSPRKQMAPSAPNSDLTSLASNPLHERQSSEPQQSTKKQSSQSLPDTSDSDDDLLRELSIQIEQAEQTRAQLKKVVEISKYGSGEHVEAARRLQIAESKHLTFCNQLAKLRQNEKEKTESLGSIKIHSLRLKMSAKLRNDLAESGFTHYFFCIASCKSQVKSTELVSTNVILKQALKTYVEFREPLQFTDLPSNFVIKLEVFELITGQPLPKFLSILTPSKRTKMTPQSCFKRIGSLKLTLADRDCNYRNLTRWSTLEESKYIDKECKFAIELKPEQLPYKFGMLHARYLGTDGRPYWTRYFVELYGAQIKFWNSKQDAHDGKKPNEVINYGDICSESVQKLTPDDDLYRQNSFLFYTFQQVAGGEKNTLLQRILEDDTSTKLVKHQLAADSKEERDSWCQTLDKSMYCFREWHGKTRIFSLDEVREIFSTNFYR